MKIGRAFIRARAFHLGGSFAICIHARLRASGSSCDTKGQPAHRSIRDRSPLLNEASRMRRSTDVSFKSASTHVGASHRVGEFSRSARGCWSSSESMTRDGQQMARARPRRPPMDRRPAGDVGVAVRHEDDE